MNNKKYVYLIGNAEIGFTAHTFDKKEKDLFMKYRKGFICKRVKANKIIEDLGCNTEIVSITDGVYLSAIEEEFFIESFNNFKDESYHSIENLIKIIKMIKFSDKEKGQAQVLKDFMKDYLDYYNNIYPEEEEDHLFNTAVAAKFFVKNVLDSKHMSYTEKSNKK